MANTIFTLKSSTCLGLGTFRRCQASKSEHPTHHHLGFYSKSKFNLFSIPDQKLALRFQKDFRRKMNMTVFANIPQGAPLPVDPSPAHWKAWVIGTIVTILLSSSRGKWGPLLQLRDKIQITIDEVERVADIVEEVAETVEKVADVATKNLPEGKLHDAAEIVGQVAENIDMLAENAGNALEKVEEMGKEMESFIESTALQEKTTVASTTAKDQK
ncbi:hypothetical protein RIF29_16927 [Crotalaria pallida]|uniref:Uncharacterized protein n=1 Tax=Crotalaria pallida TaxID=3830 RepID=A0AAN9FN88_CROPI